MNKQKFDADYFINSKISNYKNYTERKFDKLCSDLIEHCDIQLADVIRDFGCACGGLIAEFKRKGFNNIKGTDISGWAINYGKEKLDLHDELEYYNINMLHEPKDWLIVLDVLEHIPSDDLGEILKLIGSSKIGRGIIFRIPVTANEGEDFVLDVSKNDRTHIQRHSKEWWIQVFDAIGLEVTKLLKADSIYDSDGVFAGVLEWKKK